MNFLAFLTLLTWQGLTYTTQPQVEERGFDLAGLSHAVIVEHGPDVILYATDGKFHKFGPKKIINFFKL